VPLSPNNITYAFIPQSVVNDLLSRLDLQEAPLSPNNFTQGNDTVPSGIDMNDIAQVGVWWNNGIGSSMEVTR
jgi:hypothetical protein